MLLNNEWIAEESEKEIKKKYVKTKKMKTQ